MWNGEVLKLRNKMCSFIRTVGLKLFTECTLKGLLNFPRVWNFLTENQIPLSKHNLWQMYSIWEFLSLGIVKSRLKPLQQSCSWYVLRQQSSSGKKVSPKWGPHLRTDTLIYTSAHKEIKSGGNYWWHVCFGSVFVASFLRVRGKNVQYVVTATKPTSQGDLLDLTQPNGENRNPNWLN